MVKGNCIEFFHLKDEVNLPEVGPGRCHGLISSILIRFSKAPYLSWGGTILCDLCLGFSRELRYQGINAPDGVETFKNMSKNTQ